MLLSLALLAASSTFPIKPVSLAELCHRSDVIAVVRPGARTRHEEEGRHSFDYRVELEILDLLKGDVPDFFDVRFSPGMVCPAPARYPVGAVEVAFLYLNEEGHYRTVGLSYGTIFPEEEELDDFVARVRELNAIQSKLPNAWHRSEAFIEWAVKCLELPMVRGDGLNALAGTTSLADVFGDVSDGAGNDGNDDEVVSLQGRLTEMQRSRILVAFAKTKNVAHVDLELLKLLRDWKDPRVDELALGVLLDETRKRSRLDYYVMRFLGNRWEASEVQNRLVAYEALRKSGANEKRQERLESLVRGFLELAARR